MRESILISLLVIASLSFLKSATSIYDRKIQGVFYMGLLFLITGISIMLNFTLINQNDELLEKTKNKCPEYEQVQNVYILKR